MNNPSRLASALEGIGLMQDASVNWLKAAIFENSNGFLVASLLSCIFRLLQPLKKRVFEEVPCFRSPL